MWFDIKVEFREGTPVTAINQGSGNYIVNVRMGVTISWCPWAAGGQQGACVVGNYSSM